MKRVLILALLLVACSRLTTPDDEQPPLDPNTFSLQIIEGNNQTGVVADTLSSPCIVQVTAPSPGGAGDQPSRIPVPGTIVNFVVTEGGGHVFAGAALTDTAGKAAERWTLGTISGTQRMEARAVKSDGTPITYDVFKATAEPGPPVGLTLSVADTFLWVGDMLDLAGRVSASDEYGNAIETIVPLLSAPPGIEVSGTQITPTLELSGQITVSAGDAQTFLNLSASYNLNRFTWEITYRNYDSPLGMRDIVVIGLDSLFYTMQADSVEYRTMGNMKEVRVWGAATVVLWWKDAVVDTANTPLTYIRAWQKVPDQIFYSDPFSSPGVTLPGLPRRYEGGKLGSDFRTYGPVLMVGTPKP